MASAATVSFPEPELIAPALDLNQATPRDRAAINRENAQSSTGPITPEGKARVRLNATKHGLFSKTVVLPGEDFEQFQLLGLGLQEQWDPRTEEESKLVRILQETEWRMNRITCMESALFIDVAEQHREAVEAQYEGDETVISAMARAVGYRANAREFDQLHRQEARLHRKLLNTERDLKARIAGRPEDFPAATETRSARELETSPLQREPEPPQAALVNPEPGFVPSLSPAPKNPANMPKFSGPMKKEHRRQWLRKNGYAHLLNQK